MFLLTGAGPMSSQTSSFAATKRDVTMSATVNSTPEYLADEASALGDLAGKLRERLAAREGVAPEPEIDELRRLIRVLDPISDSRAADGGSEETLRLMARRRDPFAEAQAAAAPTGTEARMSNLRAALYQKALYAPLPTFYAAKGLGAVLKVIGL